MSTHAKTNSVDLVLAALAGLFTILGAAGAFAQIAAVHYPCEPDHLEIMFVAGSKVRLQGDVPVDLSGTATDGIEPILQRVGPCLWSRFTEASEAELDDIRALGEANTSQTLYDLNNIYRLRIPQGRDVWQVAGELENLPGVLSARPVPLPTPPPTPPNYQAQQGYLGPATNTPTGIDALYAWTQWGGDGWMVDVCDLEYSWNYNHADITKAPSSQINTNVADPFNDDNHGTAVIGELVADNNGWGTTGVCHGANLLTCGTYYGTPASWNVPGAIALALTWLGTGDILLLEQQWDYTGSGGYVPIEWWTHTYPNPQSNNPVYVAIQTAVAAGVIVVEAAGNGGIDMDTMFWMPDSGAIIVGGGGAYAGGTWPEGDLQRLSFSNYGSRVHLQGWGENVYTTGYGDLYAAEGRNYWYTAWFDGTSSATPIVAGAAACFVGWWKVYFGVLPPTPSYIRNLLISTGTAQVTPPAGNIGPRPDLLAAIAAASAGGNWFDATIYTDQNPLNGKGVAWGDYDTDGDIDLYVTNTNLFTSGNHLFRNDGFGLFADMSNPPVDDFYSGAGTAWGDFDNDGDPDLYLGNYGGPNRLYRNDGGGMFTDITAPPLDDAGNAATVAWVDYDRDGLLDLFVAQYFGQANSLFHNDGGGNFSDVTAEPLAYAGSYCLTGVWGDYDNDGDQDCYLCCEYDQPNRLIRNDGGGTFVDVTSGPLLMPYNTVSAAWGDLDNDGDLDLYVSNNDWGATGQRNYLLRNDGGGTFTDVTAGTPLGVSGGGMAASWGDYDNDGDLDIYLGMNPGNNLLFRNDGGGSFADATVPLLADTGNAQGLAWGDYDNDGDIDLYLVNYGSGNRLYRNDHSTGNHWFHVALVGNNSNRDGIGARIRIVAGGAAQIREVGTEGGYCTQNSLLAEFGVGTATTVDTLQIWWPRSGKSADDEYYNLPVDQVFVATEVVTGVEDEDPGDGLPTAFRLHPASPNPFNPATAVTYELPVAGVASLQIFDLSGRLVCELVPASFHAPGRYRITWDGRDQSNRAVASGIYLCHLEAGPERQTERLVLVR